MWTARTSRGRLWTVRVMNDCACGSSAWKVHPIQRPCCKFEGRVRSAEYEPHVEPTATVWNVMTAQWMAQREADRVRLYIRVHGKTVLVSAEVINRIFQRRPGVEL